MSSDLTVEALFGVLGLVGVLFAAVNLIRPRGSLGISTRRRAAGLLGGSSILLLIGVTTGPTPPEELEEVARASTTIAASQPPTTSSSTTPSTVSTSIPDVEVVFAPRGPGPSGDPRTALEPGIERATVVSITDGDTLNVRLEDATHDTVRLIGINSPERGECFAAEATLVLSILTPVGSEIGMTRDVNDRDQFDRLLRYVWVGSMSVNQELVRRGAAKARDYPPDTAMSNELAEAGEEARSKDLGLWDTEACGPSSGFGLVVEVVNADAPGDDHSNLNEEWVRIRNKDRLGVDLTGWTLKDDSASHRYDFPAGFVLAAGHSVMVLTGCGSDTTTSLYWCSNGAVWNNDGDTAYLQDHHGNLVHSLEYVPSQ